MGLSLRLFHFVSLQLVWCFLISLCNSNEPNPFYVILTVNVCMMCFALYLLSLYYSLSVFKLLFFLLISILYLLLLLLFFVLPIFSKKVVMFFLSGGCVFLFFFLFYFSPQSSLFSFFRSSSSVF